MALKKIVEPTPAAAAVVGDAPADQAAPVAVETVVVETVAPEAPATTAMAAVGLATPKFPATPAEFTEKMEKAMKTAEEFVTFGQGNVEAIVKAGQIWAAGMQDLTKQIAATTQAQMDQTVATFKAMAGVKSLKEAMDLQSAAARSAMEKAMAESGKLTDASMKLTEQTFAPITARVTLAMEKFGRAA